MKKYKVIVVGGGHAGIEAASASAKMGCSVLLISSDIDSIGKLSCNPAVGGVAKGALVKEVDALGGLMGKITDQAAIGYRILNKSKGKAVWATRAQVDMFFYPQLAKKYLEENTNIDILQAKVEKIIRRGKKVLGVKTNLGQDFFSDCVVIAVGTFLKSKIHIGLHSFSGGRISESSSDKLFDSIKSLGFRTKHFKTGTCARLDKRTIDFSKMREQPPEDDVSPFSFFNKKINKNRRSCFITYTNKTTHKIIKNNLKNSPLYAGKIKSQGVRYCPSLEDKIVKFPQKDKHQIFIEPEGIDSFEVYPNGISTSLPLEVQLKFIHSIAGLEDARMFRPGYGIEHGLIDARQLFPTLESQKYSGLFFAGQVNGTTGYEEAAAQGLIAGINAALAERGKKPFILKRNQAYIGVLIDDLIKKGTDEPYRMFTSRSEFRLSLRESNADLRLGLLGYRLGLLKKQDYQLIEDKKKQVEEISGELKKRRSKKRANRKTLFDLLREPQVTFFEVNKEIKKGIIPIEVKSEIEIAAKYEGFLRREKTWLKELKNLDKIKLAKVDYSQIDSLSKEVREKLIKFRPGSLGEAFRISGITPAAILTIYNFIKRKQKHR
ncbi:MAG: tRNA uridine-5-carboxymethylaminomethyl(34) synthesis enzyme MnmG [Candidatus Omnitrophica bacterium]|nr:tRNA uridine-5-carboxymethylaminomethyl(34) synthesis enzyme MnmG [Candidatus Omnitrophota bacterium]MCF7891585.1 tRNA uridine-5-carboxymethylaminomethyl(34) synthesis enzyme MnmG [Candidatus Omnitrophota bacterium]MCF7896107.1 tRNA uridine-5-carboxymethylaminomethyl(34) synthesis enzyme MnmG [Candidatus Omnitrophota bacterium]MCF7898089.1 tRNA uridine-5-carboxymethylaminomethyl(34) synthesis enzyme MnmG [Candidatus Omnitrophota bacterium]MCF7909872.1 tRNA uridine-5-carboxymethylaminomethyl(